MNPNKFLMGLFGAIALTACSSDDPKNINSGTTEQTTADAYIVVNIVSNDTRAGEDDVLIGDSDDYAYGDGSEEAGQESYVADAQFFFFDENGIYVGKHQRWDGGDTGTLENVEFIGKNVILLNNQGSTDYPKYLLTVLNEPNFEIPAYSNLKEVSQMLRNYKSSGNFVMSTSSFFGGNNIANHTDDYYYVTELSSSDFSTYNPDQGSPTITSTTPVVDIYVERLAAKVQLTFGISGANYVKDVNTDDFIFKTDVAIMGYDNKGEDFDDENNLAVASTPVYVKVSGWDLSATAPDSYLSKQLGEWDTTGPWDGWQKPSYYRSFWAKSLGYDDSDYTLNYKSYNQLGKSVINTAGEDEADNNIAYCNEKTDLHANIIDTKTGQPDASKITHALIKAELCIKNGDKYTGINAVKYNGVLFTYERYVDYLLDKINKSNGTLDLWKKTTSSEDGTNKENYEQIDNSYVTFNLVSEVKANSSGLNGIFTDDYKSGTGKVLAIANIPENTVLYSRAQKEDGSYEYTAISDPATTLNKLLASAQDESVEAYNGGAMYYTIPIEHETTAVTSTDKEGYYGVVRNHWYNISVDNIIRVGHGVFVPGTDTVDGEPIIPNEPEDPRYYVAARINILSWKLVKQQNVTL